MSGTSEETEAGILVAWQVGEAVGRLLRADPRSNYDRWSLKAAGKSLKRVKFEAVQMFFE